MCLCFPLPLPFPGFGFGFGFGFGLGFGPGPCPLVCPGLSGSGLPWGGLSPWPVAIQTIAIPMAKHWTGLGGLMDGLSSALPNALPVPLCSVHFVWECDCVTRWFERLDRTGERRE